MTSDDDRTTSAPATGGHASIHHYEIRVRGRLAPRWSAWLDGLDVTAADDGTSIISGPVADQAALHGVLQKLRDIGVPLVSLTEASAGASTSNPKGHDQ